MNKCMGRCTTTKLIVHYVVNDITVHYVINDITALPFWMHILVWTMFENNTSSNYNIKNVGKYDYELIR
jgi:hypothetical protein